MNKTITIIGNIGSGKSTLAKILAEKLSGILIDADLYAANPFLPLYAVDHSRWALATELFFTLSRAKKLATELKKNKLKHKVIDSGLLMGIEIYARYHRNVGTMTKEEWLLFRKLTKDYVHSSLIYPNLVIYCHCDVDTCFNRIKTRGRKFEIHHSREYLKGLENNFPILLRKLKRLNISIINLEMTTFDPRQNDDIKLLIKEIKKYVTSI